MGCNVQFEVFFESYRAGEQIYRKYMDTLDPGSVDSEFVLKNGMYIPGISMPSNCLDEQIFMYNDNIKIVKHACYMPFFRHSHTFFEMIYVYSGNAVNQLADNFIPLETGDVCILAPNVSHSLNVFSDSIIINILIRKTSFSETFIDLFTEKSILGQFFSSTLYEKDSLPYVICRSGRDAMLHSFIEMLMYEGICKKDRYARTIKENYMRTIFCYLIRNHSEHFEHIPALSFSTKNISEILSYIREHYTDVHLSELAEHFHYTVPYLSKRIKAETGRSFSEILARLRIKNACILLKTTDLPITEIAIRSGFRKYDVFYKMFQKHIGMPPKTYRSQSVDAYAISGRI